LTITTLLLSKSTWRKTKSSLLLELLLWRSTEPSLHLLLRIATTESHGIWSKCGGIRWSDGTGRWRTQEIHEASEIIVLLLLLLNLWKSSA
jgi:hypothetical protein